MTDEELGKLAFETAQKTADSQAKKTALRFRGEPWWHLEQGRKERWIAAAVAVKNQVLLDTGRG